MALTYVHGIGSGRSKEALEASNIDLEKKVQNLTEEEGLRIREFIEDNYTIEGDLRREVASNIQRLVALNCYRGVRHRKGMPVN